MRALHREESYREIKTKSFRPKALNVVLSTDAGVSGLVEWRLEHMSRQVHAARMLTEIAHKSLTALAQLEATLELVMRDALRGDVKLGRATGSE